MAWDGQGALRYSREPPSVTHKAPPDTPPEETIHTITAHFQVQELINPCPVRKDSQCTGQPTQGIELIYVSGHCHAPTCIDMVRVEIFGTATHQ